ncbi:MAG: PilZ domain-containing protein, partial [Halioglobus sp.]|nr:PilZ domain-containing protein [Halioglobus sp.]
GRSDDVSLSGMRFSTDVYLAADQTIKIDTNSLKAVAEVVRCQQVGPGWEVGVRFMNLCFARSRGSFVEARA